MAIDKNTLSNRLNHFGFYFISDISQTLDIKECTFTDISFSLAKKSKDPDLEPDRDSGTLLKIKDPERRPMTLVKCKI